MPKIDTEVLALHASPLHPLSRKPLDLVALSRPRHMVKNLLIFIPLLVVGGREHTLLVMVAFIAFCLMAGAVYAFNDIQDVEIDRKHPQKLHRPIAAGKITIPEARVFALCMATAGAALAWTLGPWALAVVAAYAVLNLFYSQGAKQLAIIDVAIVASGFALRVLLGLWVTQSYDQMGWLLIPVFFLSLGLAIGKRFAKLDKIGCARGQKVSMFYTEGRLIWLMIGVSHVTVLVTTYLTLKNWDRLMIGSNLSTLSVVLVSGCTVALLTRTITQTLSKKMEPSQMFSRDPITILSALSVVAIVGVDRII